MGSIACDYHIIITRGITWINPKMNDTALLALDLQRDFLEATGRMRVSGKHASMVIAAANRLLQHAEKTGWLPILVKHEFPRKDWIGNLLRRYAAIEGSIGAEIDPRIRIPPNGALVSKRKADAFTNPALTEILESAHIRQLLILGVVAESCVLATANSALRRSFSVTVVCDGVGSTRSTLRDSGLLKMQAAGARLKESSEIIR